MSNDELYAVYLGQADSLKTTEQSIPATQKHGHNDYNDHGGQKRNLLRRSVNKTNITIMTTITTTILTMTTLVMMIIVTATMTISIKRFLRIRNA